MTAKFGFLGWVTSGSALGTDAAPNSTPPTRTGRIGDRSKVRTGDLVLVSDGTLTVAVWVFIDDTASWFEVASGISLAGTAPVVVHGAAYPNALTFVQITTGGTAKSLGFQYN